jgi:heme/copper-type cytochrome/quinol oxidase subunit 2
MRFKVARYLCVSMILLCPSLKSASQESSQEPQERNAQVIWMTAKKYEFSPSPVHVKQGTKVELKITAIDRDHGFTIVNVPDRADAKGLAGLEPPSPQPRGGWKLRKGRETTIEFVAKATGTYEFRCAVSCGLGHGRMKGQLIVDP